MADETVDTLPRDDGFLNAATGLKVAGVDRSLHAKTHAARVLTQQQANDLYRSSGVAARLVDLPAQDMTRAGYELEIQGKDDAGEEFDVLEVQEIAGAIMDSLETLRAIFEIKRALRWESLYGGAIVVLGINDGLEPDQPVGAVESVDYLRAMHRHKVEVGPLVTDIVSPDFGRPEFYAIKMDGVEREEIILHRSRVLEFPGLVDVDDQTMEQGWSDSVYTRLWDPLREFEESYGHSAHLMYDFSQAVYRMKGLAKLIASGREAQVRARLQAVDTVSSQLNTRILDADGEEWLRQTTSVAGLPDMLDRFGVRLAAAAGIPLTLLLGLTPSGFSKNDETGQANWDDVVRGWQDERLTPQLEKLVRYLFLASAGPTSGVEPAAWRMVPSALTQLDEAGTAQLRKTTAEADAIYIQNDVLTPDEVARSRFTQAGWSQETSLDEEVREGETPPTAEEERAVAELSAPEEAAPVTEEPQKLAMNGAQVSSLQAILLAVAGDEIPLESAAKLVALAFPVSEAEALAMLRPAAEQEAKPKPVPPPSPFGVAVPPGAPEPPEEAAEEEPEPEEDPDDGEA